MVGMVQSTAGPELPDLRGLFADASFSSALAEVLAREAQAATLEGGPAKSAADAKNPTVQREAEGTGQKRNEDEPTEVQSAPAQVVPAMPGVTAILPVRTEVATMVGDESAIADSIPAEQDNVREMTTCHAVTAPEPGSLKPLKSEGGEPAVSARYFVEAAETLAAERQSASPQSMDRSTSSLDDATRASPPQEAYPLAPSRQSINTLAQVPVPGTGGSTPGAPGKAPIDVPGMRKHRASPEAPAKNADESHPARIQFSVREPAPDREGGPSLAQGFQGEPARKPAVGALGDDAPRQPHAAQPSEHRDKPAQKETALVIEEPVPTKAIEQPIPVPVPRASEQHSPGALAQPLTPAPASVHAVDVPAQSRLREQQLPSQSTVPADSNLPRIEPGSAQLVNRLEHQELRFGWNTQDFGRIEIRTVLEHNRVDASVSVSNPHLRDSLQAEIGTLNRALADHSLELSRFSAFDSACRDSGRQHAQPQGVASLSWSGTQKEPALVFTSATTRSHSGLLDLHA